MLYSLFIIIIIIIDIIIIIIIIIIITVNKNQLTKIARKKYSNNVKRDVTHKVIHPESISKLLHILGILTDHVATSQLDDTKSQVTGDYVILKNTKKN